MALALVCSSAAAVLVSQDTMGWAAAAAAADPAPVHCSVVSNEMIDSHWVAVVLISAARLAHDVAAAISGPAPAPVYIIAEMMSGGMPARPKPATISVSRSFRLNFALAIYA